MRQDRRPPLCLLSLEDRAVPSVAPGVPPAGPGDYDADSLLIRLKADAPQVLAAVAAGIELDQPLGLVDGLWSARLSAGMTVPAALTAARANPFVLYAEPNFTVRSATTPNDPRYTDGTLWGMNKIAMPAAWDVETDGSGVVVAVIDTGVDYNHPDLAANIWSNAAEANGTAGVDDDNNGRIDDLRGWDFVNGDNNPADDNSHGTHVAGTIGGVGNNGVGVVGVNWAARIMPLKFLNSSGSGSLDGAIQALNYAVASGARVSNHSYGASSSSQAFLDAINAANAAGHLVVAAAGNGNAFGQPINIDSSPFYPASYNAPNVIAVAATGSNDVFASWSNYGATSVDLAAPGVNIYSTVPGGYGYKSGTSMASPHVAGAAVLAWAADPTLTAAQVKARILAGTDPIGALNPSRPTVTNGRLNVANAVPQAPTLPRLSVSDATVTEGDAGSVNAAFTVTLSTAGTQPVTVNFATANGTAGTGDYTGGGGTLTFNPGEPLTQTVNIPVLGDLEIEPDETFTLNLSSPANATIQDGLGLGTIIDNEPRATLSIDDVSLGEGNSGTTPATFTVSLSASSPVPVTVNWTTANGTATAGADYTAGSGSVTFAPGEVLKPVTVGVTGETRFETDETFVVNLSGASNATIADGQGLGTIGNDDARPTISIGNDSHLEGRRGNQTFTFEISLSNTSYQTITVQYATRDGSALTADNDYTAKTGTVTFNPGQQTQTVTVNVRGDRRKESDETFFVDLSGAVNATLLDGEGLGTILDDDN